MRVVEEQREFLVIEDIELTKLNILGLQQQWIKFFNSKQKDIFQHKPGQLSGYFSYGQEKAVNADKPDPKEFFHFYKDTPSPDFLQRDTSKLFSTLRTLSLQSLHHILGNHSKSSNCLKQIEESQSMVMRIAYYPPASESHILAWEHEDINLITIIPQASHCGLQVMRDNFGWVSCDPSPQQAIVLFGDMIEDFTNGAIGATKHRVVGDKSERLSFNFFSNPNKNFRLSDRWSAGEFLDYRMKEIGLAK